MDLVDFKMPKPKHLEHKIFTCSVHGDYLGMVNSETGKQVGTCLRCSDIEMAADNVRKRIEHLFKISGIPALFSDKGLTDYQANNEQRSKVLNQARRFTDNHSANPLCSLIFTGATGTGKTHLAIGIIRTLINQGKHCKYTTLYDLLSSIKDTYSKDNPRTEEEIINDYIRPALIVIDEAGMNELSKTDNNLLYRIINGRYVDNKGTVIVSNVDISLIKQNLGDRIIDRLRAGGGTLIDINCESFRR